MMHYSRYSGCVGPWSHIGRSSWVTHALIKGATRSSLVDVNNIKSLQPTVLPVDAEFSLSFWFHPPPYRLFNIIIVLEDAKMTFSVLHLRLSLCLE